MNKKEHDEQVTFFNWVNLNRELAPNLKVRNALKLCYAVPNGANLPKNRYRAYDPKTGQTVWRKWSSEAKWLKDEGALELGLPDINLDVSVNRIERNVEYMFAGLRIEMKTGRNQLTSEQREKFFLLEEAGYKPVLCRSAVEAVQAVFSYLPFQEKDYQGIKEFLDIKDTCSS